MSDAELERILTEQREEYQRFVAVVFEDFRSSLQLIAESAADLQKQTSTLRDMIAKNSEDTEIIKMDLEFIKTGLKKKVDVDEFAALERRVALLERRRSDP
ncbi:MAG: hypothetical protein HYX74_11935 [Acidobacteria bacterium]|nr:hypothetical protein [Acidobacteriota bacterium]